MFYSRYVPPHVGGTPFLERVFYFYYTFCFIFIIMIRGFGSECIMSPRPLIFLLL